VHIAIAGNGNDAPRFDQHRRMRVPARAVEYAIGNEDEMSRGLVWFHGSDHTFSVIPAKAGIQYSRGRSSNGYGHDAVILARHDHLPHSLAFTGTCLPRQTFRFVGANRLLPAWAGREFSMNTTAVRTLFIGIDGGGTHCRARIEDEAGRYLGAGAAGAAATRLGVDSSIAAITNAALAAAQDAGLGADALRQMHAGIGLAGIGRKGVLDELTRHAHPFRNTTFAGDALIACLGAHDGQDGGIVIAGTGSVGFAIVGGREHRIGGYGFPISDEGSGAEVGLHAIRLSLRAHDGRIGQTPLTRDLMARFSDDPFAVVAWADRATATEFASFARRVFEYAEDGDAIAERIVRNAARQIGVLAMRLKQVAPRVSLLGGLAAPLGKWLEPKVREQLTPPAHDAVAGALLLARREAICAQSRDAAARTFSSA
jgi:glucosamine kinase